jgi:hypothetical protein
MGFTFGSLVSPISVRREVKTMKKTIKLMLTLVLALSTVVAAGYTLHSVSANGSTIGPATGGGGATYP